MNSGEYAMLQTGSGPSSWGIGSMSCRAAKKFIVLMGGAGLIVLDFGLSVVG